jgi:hypothetical protein
MAVGAQQNLDTGPVSADGADEAADKAANLHPAGALAGPQQGSDETSLAVEDDNWLEAVIVIEGVEQAQLLAAVHSVERVVDVEHDALRHGAERAAILLDERPPEAQQRPHVGQVFQPRDGRLRAQLGARRQAVEGQLEHRVAAQPAGVVAVLVAGSDHQHAEPDDLGQAMHDLLRHPRVLQAAGQTVGQSQPALNLAQG